VDEAAFGKQLAVTDFADLGGHRRRAEPRDPQLEVDLVIEAGRGLETG
jgi:hypothetical protein